MHILFMTDAILEGWETSLTDTRGLDGASMGAAKADLETQLGSQNSTLDEEDTLASFMGYVDAWGDARKRLPTAYHDGSVADAITAEEAADAARSFYDNI